MNHSRQLLAPLLKSLEAFHGAQQPNWPSDPYDFIVWWHCGYPASDERCAKGWDALTASVGIQPEQLLKATPAQLATALKAGGMVPELRALRLKEIAMRVKDHLGGDLRSALSGRITDARRILKSFPNIADPGADRILLFAGISPIAAVPSNCPHVPVRMLHGLERENYGVNYCDAQNAIATEVPDTFESRQRAYLLLKQHGQKICKRTNPKCDECPVRGDCAYAAGRSRGRASKSAGSGR